MTRNCYTVRAKGVTPGISLVVRESKIRPGEKFWAVEVGEEGRGRRLSYCRVKTSRSISTDKSNELLNAALSQNSAGYPVLVETESPQDYIIVDLYISEGFRGENYHYETEEKLKEFAEYLNSEFGLIPCSDELQGTILRGCHAQGAAGRMGSGNHYLLKMENGRRITIYRTGRTYGSPAQFILEIRDNVPYLYTPQDAKAEAE